MNSTLVNATPLPNIPWEERPETSDRVVWRYSQNPVIPRDLLPNSNSIFNSAVVPFEDAFAGVFRCDDRSRHMDLYRGFSEDGIDWELDPEPLEWIAQDPEVKGVYGYDPRVLWLEDRYYVTWCNGYNGWPTIGVGYTEDFETFHQLENAFLPYNRNGILFPRKIKGKYAMLSRPSDRGHTPFGDIFYSESPDLEHWGVHRYVMGPDLNWCYTKVGGGAVPIETSEGWLLIYHGVLQSCNGFVYSMGSALLDLEEPWKVAYRARPYLLSPKTMYECVGDVPNVVFPCAALVDGETGRMAIYYGAADTVTALAFAYVDEVVDFTKETAV